MKKKKRKNHFINACIPLFQSIQKSLVDNEMNLQDNIKKILELLGIDAGDKQRLDDIFGLMSQEISTLKGSIHVHQIQIQQQQNQLNSIELKTLMQDIKMNLYEVARLFRFYYIDKFICKHYPNLQHWNGFIGKLTTGSSKKVFLLFV